MIRKENIVQTHQKFMKVETIQDFSLNNITLISSLPDMGKVGGLVSKHIAEHLNIKPAARIILNDKPWVNQKDGIIDLPKDEYMIGVDEKNSIVVFTGENQPQESDTVMKMAEVVMDTVRKIGNIKLVISAGGYLPPEQADGTGVFGVSTNKESFKMLSANNVKPLGKEVNSITWFNGLILGQAKNQNINGIGLFGEIIDTESPQYKAASNIIQKIEKIINVKIDTEKLEDKIIPLTPESKSENPGIG